MLTVHETLDKLGLEQGEYLGDGSFASVHAIKNDPSKVIKVTGDPRDAILAEAARKVQMQGKCKNLAHVFRVIEAKAYDNANYSRFISIVERLQPIPNTWLGDVPDCPYDFRVAAARRSCVCNCPFCKDVMRYEDDMMRIAREVASGKGDCNSTVWALAAMNLKGMVDDLAYLGVEEWDDFKLDNVMIRPGDRVVMSDFGCTKSSLPSNFERIAA